MSAIACVLAGSTIRQSIVVNVSAYSADVLLSPLSSSISPYYRAGFSDITINVLGYLYATTTASAALSIGAFAAGDTVVVNNNGYILGHGGAGGMGTEVPGSAGGPAFSTLFDLLLVNNAVIAGGGGGGGGTFNAGGGGGAGGGNGGGIANGAANPTITSGSSGYQYAPNLYGGGGGGWNINVTSDVPGPTVTGGSGLVGVGGYGGGEGGGGAAFVNSVNTVTVSGGYGSGRPTVAGYPASRTGSTGAVEGGGGGGGWGAAGGTSLSYDPPYTNSTTAGGAGGAAINKNGKNVTIIGSGVTYGAINA